MVQSGCRAVTGGVKAVGGWAVTGGWKCGGVRGWGCGPRVGGGGEGGRIKKGERMGALLIMLLRRCCHSWGGRGRIVGGHARPQPTPHPLQEMFLEERKCNFTTEPRNVCGGGGGWGGGGVVHQWGVGSEGGEFRKGEGSG